MCHFGKDSHSYGGMRTKNPQPSKKKARIEVIDVDDDDIDDDEDNNMPCLGGDDYFMNRLHDHMKEVCKTVFFFDGADNLRAIQANYDRLKLRLERLEQLSAEARTTFEYQSAYLINNEWRSFPGNSFFLFTSITHSFLWVIMTEMNNCAIQKEWIGCPTRT